jgi:hypothetical protein
MAYEPYRQRPRSSFPVTLVLLLLGAALYLVWRFPRARERRVDATSLPVSAVNSGVTTRGSDLQN